MTGTIDGGGMDGRLAVAALEGVRVLDFSTGLAGPMATMMLADFGADVVKVEPPGGDPARSDAGFAMWNRGKRSIVVDAGDPAGRARLDDLLAGADVLVVSGPAADRHGGPLDPEAVRAPATSGWSSSRRTTARPGRCSTATTGSTTSRSGPSACGSRSTTPTGGRW